MGSRATCVGVRMGGSERRRAGERSDRLKLEVGKKRSRGGDEGVEEEEEG